MEVGYRAFVHYAYRYLKPGEYIITKHGKPLYRVTIKDFVEKTDKDLFYKKPFVGPISKEYSTR